MSRGLHCHWKAIDGATHMQCGAVATKDTPLGFVTRGAFAALKPDEKCQECEIMLAKESGVTCGT